MADAGTGGPSLRFDTGVLQPVSLRLTPEGPVTLVETSSGSAQQRFELRATLEDGSERVVSDAARWSVEPLTLALVNGPVLKSRGQGGMGVIRAEWRGLTATADLEIRVERMVGVNDPNLPPNPADAFANPPQAGLAPTLSYPNPGAMVPPNLISLEVHFRPARPDEDLFRVRFQGDQVDVQAFTRCTSLGDGCVYVLPDPVWQALGDTAAGRGPVTLTVEGSAAGRVSKSEPLTLSVAAARVEGGLYYWSTSRQAILRVDFGEQGAPEQFWPPPGTTGGPCYGCHALSPDGEHMTLSENGINDGKLTLLEVGTRNPLVRASNAVREQFQSWNPESTQFAGVFGDGRPPSNDIRIRDGRTAQIVETIELGFEPSHVDWSPTGDRIAVTKVTEHGSSQRPGRGGISVVTRSNGAWSAPVDLVPPVDGLNHYTPVTAPDGSFLVYARSECPNGRVYANTCDGDADPTSELWAVRFDGSAPFRLARVNAPGAEDPNGNLSDTFPKWAPFIDAQRRDGSGRLMWFTFSSRRRYGLRPPVGDNQLLWMAAVDPDAMARGEDGTFPAFALPFQDLSTSNHIAQWTRRVVPTDPPPALECLPRGAPCGDGIEGECCSGLSCVELSPGQTTCDRLQ